MFVDLQKAGVKEIPVIAQLAEEIWMSHYPGIIGQKQVDYMLARIYNPESLSEQMSQGQDFWLCLLENKAIGFVAISLMDDHEAFINKFYILSNQQNKGIGTRVFQKILQEYSHVNTWKLQVNRSNYKAINFYFRNHFTIERVADFDIGEGYFMNDFIMVFRK